MFWFNMNNGLALSLSDIRTIRSFLNNIARVELLYEHGVLFSKPVNSNYYAFVSFKEGELEKILKFSEDEDVLYSLADSLGARVRWIQYADLIEILRDKISDMEIDLVWYKKESESAELLVLREVLNFLQS